jgi:moderate conductance mechanosensitive channel
VESVGLRTVRLRDLNGTVHVIPNSTINSLSNFSKTYARAVMDIGIAYREDVDAVMGILKEVGEELEKDPEYGPNILEPLEIFGLDRFEDSAVIIRARFKTRPLQQWGVRREFYRRLKRVFDERGIEIPFPHQTIYMGEPKQGTAPPLHVSVDKRAETEGPLVPNPAAVNGDVT